MSSRFEPYDVAVVGAGISGLTCAWALRRDGLQVAMLEAGDDVGGCISTARRDGFIADGGPQTFAATPGLLEVVDAVGLSGRLAAAKVGAPYIFARGRLERVPRSPMSFFASPLLSPFAKARLLAEPFIGVRISDADESLVSFAARRAGDAVVDALVRPIVAGIYAGDPRRLSARSVFPGLVDSEQRYSSVMIGAVARGLSGGRPRRRLFGLTGGNDALPIALASTLAPELRLGVRATDLILRGARIEVAYAGASSGSVVARHVVLAAPAYESGRLLAWLEPEAAEALMSIAYAPIAQVALSYRRAEVEAELDGFGFLSGEESGLRILGCTWNSSMFDGRCPPDRVLITAFAGGVNDQAVATLRDDEIVGIAHRDLQRSLGIDTQPTVVAGFRWDRAIPQYDVGHADRLATVSAGMSRLPQVSVIGNFIRGPSTGDCIDLGLAASKEIATRLAGGSA